MDDSPIEANLGWLCRNNGSYLGKEAVEKVKINGVKRKLVHLHLNESVDYMYFVV